MKLLRRIGIGVFLLGLIIFTSIPFMGSVQLTSEGLKNSLSQQELGNLSSTLRDNLVGKRFGSTFTFSRAFINQFNKVNNDLKEKGAWDRVMWTPPEDTALKLSQVASHSKAVTHKKLFFFLTFGLGIIGALLYVFATASMQGSPGIKNDGIYHDSTTSRGWMGVLTGVWLVSFYIILYFHAYILADVISLTDSVKQIFIKNENASKWFLYGLLYTISMIIMGLRMIFKYRHNHYQIVRTIVVVLFQIIFAFLLVEILPMFGLPGKDLKSAWPLDYYFLFDWNIQNLVSSGHFGKFMFVWGIVLSVIIVPTLVYFYGKRWYCSWVCGCGGLAETLGDPYRQLSNKKIWAWKMERWMIHVVLVFAVVMTVFTGYHTYNVFMNPEMDGKEILLGVSAFDIRKWYGFLIGSMFAGVIGTGFYPIFGNRTWCRFGCPLAAYMGIVQRFKSRFRITTNGGQCISCGNCSTYCEQGIDVRAYAQKGQNIVRASCVGCGVCSAVCPRGVLKLENGPEEGRIKPDNPIVFGNDGFKLQD